MKQHRLLYLLFLLLVSSTIFCQNNNGFNSVFQDIDHGDFQGSANGLIIIKDSLNKVIYDFQGSKASLELIKDYDTVYDVSRKSYSGFTTSGKTEIKYETYATSNMFGIQIQGEWFEESNIDGACEYPIENVKYIYQTEKETEYLILLFTDNLVLNNWQYLIRTEYNNGVEEIDYSKLKSKEKSITVLKNSTIVFAIKRM